MSTRTELIKNRQRKTKDPCPECFLHKNLCLCELIPRLTLTTKVVLVIHAKELKRTTNTGRLALKALTNSELRVRGEIESSLDLSELLHSNYQSLLFYPSSDALDLTPDLVQRLQTASDKPFQLIVPDGNWRQASKVHTRHPELKDIPRVMIQAPNTAANHLRAESRAEGMATLQAIACALRVLEGPAVGEALSRLYETKLERTLLGRGQRLKE